MDELKDFENYFKKHWILICSVFMIVLLVYFLFILSTGTYSNNSENIYYFPKGSFSTSFPQQPTFETNTQQLLSSEGNVSDIEYIFNSTNTGTGYGIQLVATYISSAFKNPNTPEENLSKEVAYTIKQNGYNLISSNATTYNGLPAVDYVSCQDNQPQSVPGTNAVSSNQWCIKGKDILKDNNLYMFDYKYQSVEEDKTLEQTFLNSVVFGEQPIGSIIVDTTTDNTTSTSPQTTIVPTKTDTTTEPSTTEPAPIVTPPPVQNAPTPPTATSIVPGCTSANGYSSTNGASCGGTRIAQIVSKWSPNVALILCNYSDGTADFGSGFLYDDPTSGILVYTNKHVFTEESTGYNATSCSLEIPGDANNFTITNTSSVNNNYPFQIGSNGDDWGFIEVGNTPDSYLNNTAVSSKNLTICQQKEQTGDNIIILGYPDYAGQFTSPTATEGIISGYASPYYTTSAQIESGNSGGVAIDPDRDCYVGIPSAVKIGNYANLGRILNADVLFNLNY